MPLVNHFAIRRIPERLGNIIFLRLDNESVAYLGGPTRKPNTEEPRQKSEGNGMIDDRGLLLFPSASLLLGHVKPGWVAGEVYLLGVTGCRQRRPRCHYGNSN